MFPDPNTSGTIKDHLKIRLGALVFPTQTRRWRGFLDEHPRLAQLAARYPRVLHKIYRPYLSRQLRCSDRVDVLIGHYRQIIRAGLLDLVTAASDSPVAVAGFVGKSGSQFSLRLAATNFGHREGELTLQLVYEDTCIYMATFVLIEGGDGTRIELGVLQGMRDPNGRQIIREATREMYGCRPKNFIVSVVRGIGVFFGCSTLHLVSNSNRVSINRRRSRRIAADYDETWTELCAVRRADGNFELPCMELPVEMEKVPSHKRSEARKRAALLEAACDTLRSSLRSRADLEMEETVMATGVSQ